MAGRSSPLLLLAGCLLGASAAGAGDAGARTAQLRAGWAPPVTVSASSQAAHPPPAQVRQVAPTDDAVRLHGSGPSRWAETPGAGPTGSGGSWTSGSVANDMHSALDAPPGKWGVIADFFADFTAPLTKALGKAASYFAPGRGYSSLHRADNWYEKNFISLAITFLIVAALTALFAHYYERRRHADPELAGRTFDPMRVPTDDWAARDIVNPKRWLAEKEICFMSCFCPCIRWAETISTPFPDPYGGPHISILSFWYAFLMYLFLVYMDAVTTGTVFWLALVIMLTYYRSKIREVFGLTPVTWFTVFADLCCFCWCTPCAIAQEARNVDKGIREGSRTITEEIHIKERIVIKEKVHHHFAPGPGGRRFGGDSADPMTDASR